jgi:hypothetical protein
VALNAPPAQWGADPFEIYQSGQNALSESYKEGHLHVTYFLREVARRFKAYFAAKRLATQLNFTCCDHCIDRYKRRPPYDLTLRDPNIVPHACACPLALLLPHGPTHNAVQVHVPRVRVVRQRGDGRRPGKLLGQRVVGVGQWVGGD